MARRYRPGRTLVAFLAGTAVLFGLVAVAGTWKPALGLDLQGGTRITLIAKGDPTEESLREAAAIIDSRVNGSGVAEAEVVTQGNRFIVVEIPGDPRRDLVETVERQAQLRFRLVASSSLGGTTTDPGTVTPQPPTPEPSGDGQGNGNGNGNGQGNGNGNGGGQGDGGDQDGANRGPVAWAETNGESPSEAPSEEASDAPTDAPTDGATDETAPSDGASPTAEPTIVEQSPGTDGGTDGGDGTDPRVAEALQFQQSPDQQWVQRFNEFTCPEPGTAPVVDDDPDQPLVTCDEQGVKYLLSEAVVEGNQLDDANTLPPDQQNSEWRVGLEFDGPGSASFADVSRALVGTQDLFAIVLDGQVISAPTMNGLITNGQAEISGSFTQTTADSLATSLRFGALPIAFEDPSTETIGPSLAGDQLTAGLTAGAFGLGLVLIYCLLYYRGLGLVVVASLLAAAAVTYALVLLLSETAGFTLTLPGIAGLIIAVGVTADSFIIFFERIRDEMREGKTMRVAVETGWKRAKVTRLAAQVVSLLSAAVLYIFATGAVKGFGFALGLTTLVDLAILFWFTKPMMSWLATFRFFNSGGRLSGLSRETLGMDGPTGGSGRPATVGGKA